MNLPELAVRRPVATFMAFVAVRSWAFLHRAKVDLLPEIGPSSW